MHRRPSVAAGDVGVRIGDPPLLTHMEGETPPFRIAVPNTSGEKNVFRVPALTGGIVVMLSSMLSRLHSSRIGILVGEGTCLGAL